MRLAFFGSIQDERWDPAGSFGVYHDHLQYEAAGGGQVVVNVERTHCGSFGQPVTVQVRFSTEES